MRVFFARHGESEANVARVFSTRGWKHPLTTAGREQARALAGRLAGHDVMAIWSSPLRRAVETAVVLTGQLGVPHVTDPALGEYDVGMYDGLPYADAAERVADLEARWDRGERDARLPGGESCNDILARFEPFVGRLIEQFASMEAAIVVVSHGGTLGRALPVVLKGVVLDGGTPRPLGYTAVVEAELRDGVLHCVSWGDSPPA
jgi:probable phosphoglycerate mutase